MSVSRAQRGSPGTNTTSNCTKSFRPPDDMKWAIRQTHSGGLFYQHSLPDMGAWIKQITPYTFEWDLITAV